MAQVNIEVTNYDENAPSDWVSLFSASVKNNMGRHYEFDFDANTRFLSTSEEEILLKIRDCDDDAFELIQLASVSGDDVVLNGIALDADVVRSVSNSRSSSPNHT